MAKNKIQFQKGMSIPDFIKLYGTEDKCQAALFSLRWPNGFRCPRCDNKTYCEIKKRKILQCSGCHFQTSLTAGTIFHSTKLPLRKWFLAMFLITQCKNGISALELSRHIGASYNATWRLKQKLMQVMLERGSTKNFPAVLKLMTHIWVPSGFLVKEVVVLKVRPLLLQLLRPMMVSRIS